MSEIKKPFHETVAEKLIAQLIAGTAPWQQPWLPGAPGAFLPINPTTGKRYRGINAIHLMSQGHSDQRWMTYKQAAAAGAQVRKGEKGSPIQYWKFSEEQTKTGADGKPVLDAQGETVKQSVRLERPRVFLATVFNAEQIDGLPPIQARKEQTWRAVERAEQILQASGAVIRHGEQNSAFYRPATDSIHLPDKGQFPSADNYYAIALHELGHWTGHKARLNRDLTHPFGSEGYAKEELRAEIASMILGDELGIGHDPAQHAAYVGSWIKCLQDDPLEIFRAAADAERIQAYVLGLVQTQVQEQPSAPSQAVETVALLAELRALHLASVPGDSPLNSWENIRTTALEHGLVAAIGRGRADGPPYAITYADKDGNQVVITTSLYPDGKALTSFDGERVAGTGYTADAQWQSAVLGAAVSQQRRRDSGQEASQQSVADTTAKQYAAMFDADKAFTAELKRAYGNAAGAMRYQFKYGDPAVHASGDAYVKATDTWREAVNAAREQLENANEANLQPAQPEVADPNSTNQAMSAAARNDAESTAMQNDANLQPRSAEFACEKQQEQEQAALIALPAQLTRDAFAQIATAVSLENHGRRWEVFVGTQSFGFSDAHTAADAVYEAHKREVNNALYSRSTENTGVVPVQSMPSERVLSAYPDLQQKFADTVNFNQHESQSEIAAVPEKILINVPFKQKGEARALGAKWDRQEQSWYVPAGVDHAPFTKWAQVATKAGESQQATRGHADRQKPTSERQYLAVPFGERVVAKAAGAEWDKTAKSWYAGPKADMAKLERWKPDTMPVQQGPAMMPQEEFAEALRCLGCVVSGEHPIMDGQKHRISVEGEKHSEKAGSGFYVGYLDGHPAGYIKNNKTGIDMKWKSKGYVLDPQQKAQMQAEAAAKLQAREAEHARMQEQAALRVGRQMIDLVPIEQPTPYMQAKGIKPQLGVLTDKDCQKTYIPATDVDGKQWTMQIILADGTKRFAKDSRKEGCFHVVGGMDALAKAPTLVIAEGYATASSLSQSLGFATVAAFDAGNLPQVARALHAKFPDKPIIIAGDDDQHLEATQGVNPGKTKAQEAAKATGGKVLLPIFAPGEQAANPKGFTDFNDLATKSALGKEGIDRQVRSIVGSVIEQHQARTEQQERVRQQDQRPRRAVKIG